MTKSKITRVSKKTAKALKDRTDWNQLYRQSEHMTEENSNTDPEAPVLAQINYIKPGKGNKR